MAPRRLLAGAVLVGAVLVVTAFVALALPASASGSSPSGKFCKAYANVGRTNDAASLTPRNAGRIAAKFRAAGKVAPPTVKKATDEIASALSKLARVSARNPSDVANFFKSTDFEKYGKAIGTFYAYGERCPAATTPTT